MHSETSCWGIDPFSRSASSGARREDQTFSPHLRRFPERFSKYYEEFRLESKVAFS
jgi:hypothetical protein